MSSKERDRLKVLHAVRKRHITQEQAGKELGVSARWVRELQRRMRAPGRPGRWRTGCGGSGRTGATGGPEGVGI